METITIDKAIDVMKNYREYTAFSQINGRIKAVEIMRKYQKIEEIVTQWQNETDPKIKFARSNIEKIKEVIEDGKVE